MSDSLFDNPAPRLFTLPPQADFLRSIATRLRLEFDVENNPDALSGVMVLVPTRRAARALGDAFAASAGSGVALLPMIRPIGEFDVDDPPFEPGELSEIAPEAISSSRRRFELARLILAKEEAIGRPVSLGGALALAEPMAALLDDLATEDCKGFAELKSEISEHLPEDRREAADFLAIIEQIWPQRLTELGLIDPATRRTRVLEALAQRWRDHPPAHPVIAMGSTGSIPAVGEVMKIVASLPQGLVVLPGFDWDADDEAWKHIDDSHPQWAMRDFVKATGCDRKQVKTWPDTAEDEPARARRRVIAEALRPAEATSDWMGRIKVLSEENGSDFFERGLAGLSLIETPDQINEARTCALLLREVLDKPDQTAILVTPDRNLARRISVEMARFGVKLDDSGGQALPETRAAALLSRILDLALDPGSCIALSSLWSSPLFCMGGARGVVHSALGKFEAEALRGVRPGRDMKSVIARLEGKHVKLHEDDAALVKILLERLDEAMSLLAGQDKRSAAQWAEAHVRAAEAIAGSDTVEGAVNLWTGEGGESAANLLRELLSETSVLPDMSLLNYVGMFRELARSRRIPPKIGVHPRLQVLGPLEARLLSADRTILAGLNEGVWPAGVGADPWLSRGMRDVVGLGAPERRHGLAAHDFSQLAASGEVFLTRSEKVDGTPTVASRWVWRLKTLCEGALGEEVATKALTSALDYKSVAHQLNAATSQPRPAPAPSPVPDVKDRPRRLSVTEIRTWVRDPYAIYAKHVLGLKPLDAADMPPGPRERGTALHDALHIKFQNWQGDLPETAIEELVAQGRIQLIKAGFPEEELAIELPRFARASTWLVGWEKLRRARGYSIDRLEIKGELNIDLPAGEWTLSGRADRFDRHPDGRLDIIDYKTGTSASPKEVAAGFDPQLPLTAAMARAGAFADLTASEPEGLYYLSLPGNVEGGKERRIDGQRVSKSDPTGTAAEMADQALQELTDWISHYDKVETAYLSQPRAKYTNSYGDFDHLARRSEWASAAGEDGEGTS